MAFEKVASRVNNALSHSETSRNIVTTLAVRLDLNGAESKRTSTASLCVFHVA